MKEKNKYDYNAVNLFRSSKTGILSTFSQFKKDYPFGSFVTYVTGKSRVLYLYLSDIAQHTKNLKENPKACITIFGINNKGDVQDSKRLTLLGDLKSVSKEEQGVCENRFFEIMPESKSYSSFHGFNFYKLEINSARWIGGFGKIGWLNTDFWGNHCPEWAKNETSIVNHMNEDHANTIYSALHAQHNIKDENAKMLFLTIDGYYVKSNDKIFFIQLENQCLDSKEYRASLVDLAKKYRTFEKV